MLPASFWAGFSKALRTDLVFLPLKPVAPPRIPVAAEQSLCQTLEKSHHVCLMRNVSGRKVLSTAKQVFYFLHVKSFISATSHLGGNCPEGCLGLIPRSPAEGSLFPPTNEFNFGPCHFASGHHSSDLHLPPLLQAAIQLSSSHQGIPLFLSHLLSLSRVSPLCSPASAFCPLAFSVICLWPKPHALITPCSLVLASTKSLSVFKYWCGMWWNW